MFCQNVVFKNDAKFKGKHLRSSLLLNKVTGLQPESLSNCDTGAFIWIFKIFENTFFEDYLEAAISVASIKTEDLYQVKNIA